MKVTVCAKYFKHKGGAQTFLIEFVRHLLARGHAVRVLALDGEPMEGVEVRVLGEPALLPKSLRDWSHGRRLARELASDDGDVSFGEQKMWGCDVVRPGGGALPDWEAHYVRSHEHGRALLRLSRAVSLKRHFDQAAENRVYAAPGPRRVVANARLVERDLLRHYPQLAGRIVVIHNGANLDRFSPELAAQWRAPVLRELDLPPDALTLLFVGHDFRRKGLRQTLETLQLLEHYDPAFRVQLLVLGRGRTGRYRRLAARLGVLARVRFVGGSRQAERFYAAADVLMLPTFYDPCANVTLEALAAGLPVVTTVTNGGCEVLTHGRDGWLINDPRDLASMADALLDLRDPARLAAMKSAAYATALRHPIQSKLAAIADVLEQVVREKEGGS